MQPKIELPDFASDLLEATDAVADMEIEGVRQEVERFLGRINGCGET